MQTERWKFTVIALVIVGFMAAWHFFGITLGIDLAGGTQLIYELDTSKLLADERNAGATDTTVAVLQRRIDSFGLKELSIRRAGDFKIVIQMPGVSQTGADQIKKVIESSGKLEFKIVYKGEEGSGWRQLHRSDPEIKRLINEVEQAKALGQYREIDYDYDTALYQERDKKTGDVTAEWKILLLNEYRVVGDFLAGAKSDRDEYMQPAVGFRMTADGARKMGATSKANLKKAMAIVLDGVVQSAPTLQATITDRGIITGQFTQEQVNALVTVLKSGALPAKPVLQSEDTIAPTLGEESVRRGMFAVLFGVILTLLFMLYYYRMAGAIANVALILNLIVLFGVMGLMSATLTLPGIAGIVLTMGMAVDANILINERIREESDRGMPVSEAVSAGYRHAWSAIIDSNVTTLLTAWILYSVGTGPIRGFAVTLMIGIASSLFTALWVTRVLFDYVVEKGYYTKPNYVKLLANANYPFLKMRRPFVIAALVLLNLGFVAFAVRGPDKYGIDFNGGAALRIRLQTPLTMAAVKDRLQAFTATEEGKTVKPYESVEVQRMGAPEEDGSAREFQLLLNARGRELERSGTQANEGSAAALRQQLLEAEAKQAGAELDELDEDIDPSALEAPQPEQAVAEEDAEAAPSTMQAKFMADMAGLFKKELVVDPYGTPVLENVAGTTDQVRLRLEVRLDPVYGKKLDAQEVELALQRAGVELAADAQAPQAVSATALALRNTEVTRRDQVLDVLTGAMRRDIPRERMAMLVQTVIGSKFAREIASPFPSKMAIGSSVAKSMRGRAMLAIILSLCMIIAYIAFRFELKAGLAAAMCLFHDVCVTLGAMMVFDVTSGWTGLESKINLTTVAAFLTIVGYSINDTIVTFDRIRENLQARGASKDREAVMEKAINQVLSRTVLTSLTVLVVLFVLFMAGVSSLTGFTLALIVGVIFGTYSSIYVATPILLADMKRLRWVIVAELVFVVAITLAL